MVSRTETRRVYHADAKLLREALVAELDRCSADVPARLAALEQAAHDADLDSLSTAEVRQLRDTLAGLRLDALSATPGPAAQDLLTAAAKAEESVIDRIVRRRTDTLVEQAVADTLAAMGLAVDTRSEHDGSRTFRGVADGEASVEVVVDRTAATVEVTSEDHADAVHPLHPAADDACRPAAEMALKFHLGLAERSAVAGVGLGRVQAVTPARRGSPARRAASRSAAPRAAGGLR